MEDEGLDLILNYPLISRKERRDKSCYEGIIVAGDRDHKLRIFSENGGFRARTATGDEIMVESGNIIECLDKITAILESQSSHSRPKNYVNVYKRVLHEYCEFVKFHLNIKTSTLSPDLSQMNITTIDEGGRQHSLQIAVDFNEINIFRAQNLNLPEQFTKDLSKNFANLTEVYEQFLTTINNLQSFFNTMDALDENCCILDPEEPNRGHCYRRIWLDQNSSVLVIVDPFNVTARPELKFLGPERLILHYRQKLNLTLDKWDENTDLVQGLLDILGIDSFPRKPAKNCDILMDTGECSICFALRLNDQLPEIVCSNKSCENSYHIDCLYEWLTSINSKRIFNQVHGQCPNCEKAISCPLPDVNEAT